MEKSITIMIPAYNEKEHLQDAVDSTDKVLKKLFKDYEILIFDDCSTDRTGKIADRLAKKNDKIKVLHNKKNRGLGYNFRTGAKFASKEYYGWVPGDNEIQSDSVEKILSKAGEADIIISYTGNMKKRALIRRIISNLFTTTLNLLFNLKVKYYNGIVVYRTELLRKIDMRTDSFAYQAEILVQLLKKGYTYIEVPQYVKVTHESRMLILKDMLRVAGVIIRLFYHVNIKR